MPPKVEPEPVPIDDNETAKKGGCCGCCKGAVAPDGPVKVDPAFWGEKKSCKDFSFCLLFLAFWVGMVVVLITAATNGNGNGVESLVFGKDYQGTTCGVDNAAKAAEGTSEGWAAINLKTKPLLYFPLDGQNYDANQDVSDITLYGVCHNECPDTLSDFEFDCKCLQTADTPSGCFTKGGLAPGRAADHKFGTTYPSAGYAEYGVTHDCVCEYDDSLCWKVDYPTKEVMYRCIPCADPSQADCTPEKVYQTKCVSTADSSDTSIVAGDVACPTDGICAGGCYKYLLTTVETQVQPDNAIGDVVSGGFATVIAYINDLFSCKWVILTCGAAIAMTVSWVWVFLLKLFVKPLVWITILAVLGGLAILTFVGLCKSGQLSTAEEKIEAYASVGGSTVKAYGIPLAPEAEAWMWALMWIFGGIFFFISFILLCLKQKQIRMATAVIKEASNALKDMPLMIVFPLVPMIICLLFFTYFLMGAAFIWTAVSRTRPSAAPPPPWETIELLN
eukprot:COSAG06_NODE_878_length_11812_cov_5.549560_3_plen_504_part_00